MGAGHQAIDETEKYRLTTQELQLISKQSSGFSWVLGGYYFRYTDEKVPIAILQGPLNAPLPTSATSIRNFGSSPVESFAGFAQATIDLTPTTHLTGGVRYTTEKRKFNGLQIITLNNGVVIPNANEVHTHISSNKLTFRAAINQDLADRVIGYLSFDRGFKSGGFNLNDVTNPAYRPEVLDAYQAGVKAEMFDRRVRLNVAAFYYDYTNLQTVNFNIVSVISNAATAEMYGLDLDGEAHFDDHFFVTAGLSLLHAKYKSYPQATFSVPAAAPGLPNRLVTGDASGNTVPFAQPISFIVGLNYTLDTSWGNLLFNINNSYNGRYFYEAN